MKRRTLGGSGRIAAAAAALAASVGVASVGGATSAEAALPHVVQPGETLWGISAANNLTTRTVAVFNGLPEDAHLIAGQTIQVPTVEEGAAALAAAGITPGSPSSSGSTSSSGTEASSEAASTSPTYGLGHIWSPWGELHLDPAAANAWNAMRQASLSQYGIDLYPDGPLSAYRTYEQQAELYNLYISGQGPLAAPPGTSAHERGVAVDVAEPIMRQIIDEIGAQYGWAKTSDAPNEWWHVVYVGGY
jgi:LysM repeat protein